MLPAIVRGFMLPEKKRPSHPGRPQQSNRNLTTNNQFVWIGALSRAIRRRRKM